MSDSLRTNLFASKLNGRLGKPHSCNRFEYVDIVLPYNTVFPSHLDKKNGHRPGYDHCAMYTFATNVSGRVCRRSVTSRKGSLVPMSSESPTSYQEPKMM